MSCLQVVDEAALLQELEPLILGVSRVYMSQFGWLYPVREDYVQMLRLETVRAIRRWRPDGGASVRTYVDRALRNESQNVVRDRKLQLLSHRVSPSDLPQFFSLDLPCVADDGDASLGIDLLPGPDDTSGSVQIRDRTERIWGLAAEILARRGARAGERHQPAPLLTILELSVGRRGAPLSQVAIAERLGYSQNTISRWLRQIGQVLRSDPRVREIFADE